MDVDLRIRKSKHHLRKSIITLLQTVPYADINISMICKEANVSRVTFYNYYKNKNELAEDIVKILFESTIKKTHKETGSAKVDICYFQCLLINIIEVCYSYEKIIPAMKSVGNLDLKNVIDSYFYDAIKNTMKQYNLANKIAIDYNVATSLVVGGFVRMVFDWLKLPITENREESKDRLEATIKEIFSRFFSLEQEQCCEECDTNNICPASRFKY